MIKILLKVKLSLPFDRKTKIAAFTCLFAPFWLLGAWEKEFTESLKLTLGKSWLEIKLR